MKRIISLGVLLIITFSLCACGNQSDLQSQIDELNRKVNGQATKISDLETEKALQDAKIVGLEDENAEQDIKIAELEKESERQDERISELEAEKNRIEDGFSQLSIGIYDSFVSYHNGWVYVEGLDYSSNSAAQSVSQTSQSVMPLTSPSPSLNCLYRMRPDGSEKHNVLLHDAAAFGFIFVDDWIYYKLHVYTDGENNIYLFRMSLSGSVVEEIAQDVDSFAVSGDFVYYTCFSDDTLYRIDSDGSNKLQIAENCTSFLIGAGYVFVYEYTFLENIETESDVFTPRYSSSIIRFNPDGTRKLVLYSGINVGIFYLISTHKDYVYFQSELYLGSGYTQIIQPLHRVKIDASARETITSHDGSYTLDSFIFKGDYIYYSYSCLVDGNRTSTEVFRIGTNGKNRVKLFGRDTEQIYDISFADNCIFYYSYLNSYEDMKLHRFYLNKDLDVVIYDNTSWNGYAGFFVSSNNIYIIVR